MGAVEIPVGCVGVGVGMGMLVGRGGGRREMSRTAYLGRVYEQSHGLW